MTIIFQGPKEAVIGLLFGVGWGILVILLPGIFFLKEYILFDFLQILINKNCSMKVTIFSKISNYGSSTIELIIFVILSGKDDEKMGRFRFIALFLGGLLAYFGSKYVALDGSGALAVLVMAFVAGIGWRKFGWNDDNVVNTTLADFWIIFQPILFGLIGTEIQVSTC